MWRTDVGSGLRGSTDFRSRRRACQGSSLPQEQMELVLCRTFLRLRFESLDTALGQERSGWRSSVSMYLEPRRGYLDSFDANKRLRSSWRRPRRRDPRRIRIECEDGSHSLRFQHRRRRPIFFNDQPDLQRTVVSLPMYLTLVKTGYCYGSGGCVGALEVIETS